MAGRSEDSSGLARPTVPGGASDLNPREGRSAAPRLRREVPSILGEPVHTVEDAEELLWRVAAFLDRQETTHARQNLRARIRKALAGGDWREALTDGDVVRYG